MSTVTEPLTMAAAVATGLIAGLFFFCSVALMPALARLDQSAGIRAMQAINVVIVRPLFLLVFLGAAVGTGVLALLAPEPLHLVAAACYLIGVIVVSATANIPLNNSLDAVAADSAEGERLWQRYLSRWTVWNHVRTLTATAATLALILA
ncbi:MAG TPA: anthrone oxygenase family protein [Pseudonocardia sp.]|nr:anthrone oxygenase family protein [Pseudonocardia sp.]